MLKALRVQNVSLPRVTSGAHHVGERGQVLGERAHLFALRPVRSPSRTLDRRHAAAPIEFPCEAFGPNPVGSKG